MNVPARICIFGNSHLAAIRSAWDEYPQALPMIEPSWFGAPRDQLAQMVVRNGKLLPGTQRLADNLRWTSGGLDRVDPAAFDVFVIVGLGPSFTRAARMYQAFRADYQSQDPKPRYLLSADAYKVAITGIVASSPSMALACMIRSLTPAPVYVIADPLPAENALSSGQAPLWQALSTTGDGRMLASAFFREVDVLAASLEVEFIDQPEETRAGVFSRDELRRGALRMREKGGVPFTDEDYGHLGPDYGLVMLRLIADKLVQLAQMSNDGDAALPA